MAITGPKDRERFLEVLRGCQDSCVFIPGLNLTRNRVSGKRGSNVVGGVEWESRWQTSLNSATTDVNDRLRHSNRERPDHNPASR